MSKKYVSKEVAKEIHEKAAPIIKWLKEAEEESEESEEDEDEMEVSKWCDKITVPVQITVIKLSMRELCFGFDMWDVTYLLEVHSIVSAKNQLSVSAC